MPFFIRPGPIKMLVTKQRLLQRHRACSPHSLFVRRSAPIRQHQLPSARSNQEEGGGGAIGKRDG